MDLGLDGLVSGRRTAEDAVKLLPDVIGPGLEILFSGINPSLLSAATGHHFARPGNRFWPSLYRAGFTPRQLKPEEQAVLIEHGLGVTNVAARPTARADELSADELVEGGAILAAKCAEWRPAYLAVLGVTAYRKAFDRPKAMIGRQRETLGGVPVWVLPNPSGLNAHFNLDQFMRLREVI